MKNENNLLTDEEMDMVTGGNLSEFLLKIGDPFVHILCPSFHPDKD